MDAIINNISALALIIISLIIVLITMLQEEKGEGMGSAFGDLGSFDGKRGQSRDMILKKYTKIFGIIFSVIIIAVCVFVYVFR